MDTRTLGPAASSSLRGPEHPHQTPRTTLGVGGMTSATSSTNPGLSEEQVLRAISQHPLLATLDADGRELLAREGQWAFFRTRRLIARGGEAADSVAFLLSGSVRLSSASVKGREPTIGFLVAPNVLCVDEALTQEPTDAVQVLGAADVIRLNTTAFRWMVDHQPRFAIALCKQQAQNARLRAGTERSFPFETLEARVARLLLRYAATIGKTTADGIVLAHPLSQETLARDLGVSRRSLHQAMMSFKTSGVLVKRRARYCIVDQSALLAEHGRSPVCAAGSNAG
ncbi:MAG: Crp/Fnr family transcriptional regulator [Deltaproteobacteria bacterium]|nr:Crp/Fnr family transcriptional regulator [Deltaproteobacteria bacterium]